MVQLALDVAASDNNGDSNALFNVFVGNEQVNDKLITNSTNFFNTKVIRIPDWHLKSGSNTITISVDPDYANAN